MIDGEPMETGAPSNTVVGIFPRAVLSLFVGAWGVAMMVLGLLAACDWPDRLGSAGASMRAVGSVLASAGVFVSAVLAARLFPGARRWVVVSAEVLPWCAAGALVLVWLGGSR